MGFEVFTVVKIHILASMVMIFCSLAVVMNVSDEYTVSVIRVIFSKLQKGERWVNIMETRRSSQSVKEQRPWRKQLYMIPLGASGRRSKRP